MTGDHIEATIGDNAQGVIVGKKILQQIIHQEVQPASILWYRKLTKFLWIKKAWKRYCNELALSLAQQEGVDREFSELTALFSPSDLPVLLQSGEYKLSEIIDGLRLRNVILLGDPGCGKTTSLRHLAMRQARRTVRSPKKFRLPVFASLGSYTGGDILEFLKSRVGGYCGMPLSELLVEYLSRGRLIIFFDAMNEMPGDQYAENIKKIRKLIEDYPLNRYVFSCRSDAYNGELEIPAATIKALDNETIRAFSVNYLGEEGEIFYERLEKEDLVDMVRNPFFLLMVLKTRNFPKSKGEMLEHFLEILLKREKSKGDIRRSYDWAPVVELKKVLEQLAYLMTHHYRTTVISRKEVERFLNESLRTGTGYDFISQGCETLILRYTDDRRRNLGFWHHIIQEFLAASYLERRFDELKDEELKSICCDEWWWEPLILLSGIIEKKDDLIKRVLGKSPNAESLMLSLVLVYNSGASEEKQKNDILNRFLKAFRKEIRVTAKEIIIKLMKAAGKQFIMDLRQKLPVKNNTVNEQVIRLLTRLGGTDVVNMLLDWLYTYDGIRGKRTVLSTDLEKLELELDILDINGMITEIEVEEKVKTEKDNSKRQKLKKGETLCDIIYRELPKIGQPVVEPLINRFILEPEADISLRMNKIVKLITEIGDPAVEVLLEMVSDLDNRDLRFFVATILKRFKDNDMGIDLLCQYLGDPDAELHHVAVKSLQTIGNDKVFFNMEEILREKDWKRQLAVVEVLREIDSKISNELLTKGARSRNPEVRAVADFVLNTRQKPKEVSWVRQILYNPESLSSSDFFSDAMEEIELFAKDEPTEKKDIGPGKEDGMTFFAHIEEMFKRLVYGLESMWLFFFLAVLFYKPLVIPAVKWLYGIQGAAGQVFRSMWLPTCLYIGMLLMVPFFLFQVWLFARPALYRHERIKFLKFLFTILIPAFFFLCLTAFWFSKKIVKIISQSTWRFDLEYAMINRMTLVILILIIGILAWLFLKVGIRRPEIYDYLLFFIMMVLGPVSRLIAGKERFQALEHFSGQDYIEKLLRLGPFKYILGVAVFIIIVPPHFFIPIIITALIFLFKAYNINTFPALIKDIAAIFNDLRRTPNE